MTEKIYLRMRICVSGRQQNHKKIKKNQERIIRPFLTVDVVAVVDASTTATTSLCRPYDEKNEVDEFHLRCSKKVDVDEIHLRHFF
jgi:hypothetical protein